MNVASEAGIVGMYNQAAYNVSKSGKVSLAKSSALDFALKNIRVNCICPGRCHTPLVQKVIDNSGDPGKTLITLSEDRPLKRMAKPDEIASGTQGFPCTSVRYILQDLYISKNDSTASTHFAKPRCNKRHLALHLV